MAISMAEQGMVFLFSCFIGILLGVFYDIFRIARIAFNPGFIIIFIEDIIFCLCSSVIVVLFVYHINSGIIRWFALFGCALAFAFYYFTVGKFVMFLSEKLIRLISALLRFIYNITVVPARTVIKFLIKTAVLLIKKIIALTIKACAGFAFHKRKRKFISEAGKGFGLHKLK